MTTPISIIALAVTLFLAWANGDYERVENHAQDGAQQVEECDAP